MGFHEFLNCSFYYTGPVYTIYPIIQSVSSLEILVSNDSTFCWSFKFSALSPSIIASLTFDKQSLTISYMFFVRSYLKLTNWLLMFWNFSSIEPHRAAKDWVNQVLVSWISCFIPFSLVLGSLDIVALKQLLWLLRYQMK